MPAGGAMHRHLLFLGLLVAFPAAAFADQFDITINITSTTDQTVIPSPGVDHGTFITNGSCLVCTPAGGGLTEFQISLSTGASVHPSGPVLFDAFDSSNSTAMPQYNSLTHVLTGAEAGGALLLQENVTVGATPTLLLLELSSTTLDTAPACADPVMFVGTGCVSVRPVEGIFATGTYSFTTHAAPVPEPSAVILLLTVIASLAALRRCAIVSAR